MVVSTYQKLSGGGFWYSGQIFGATIAKIKIACKGPWIQITEHSDGTYKIQEIPKSEHGDLSDINNGEGD